jgi:hypothetical protein
MSIDPNLTYRSFTFIAEDDGIEWTIPGPLSGDLVAGLLIALDLITDELVEGYLTRHNLKRVEIVEDDHMLRLYLADPGDILETIRRYRIQIVDDIPYHMRMITQDRTYQLLGIIQHGQPHEHEFGWFIQDAILNKYVLYSFRSPEFIQGIISMFNAFGMYFEQRVYGLPFIFDPTTKTITYYEIEGYDIEL